MKSMRRFLIGWMVLHLLILFPMQSKAEEDVVQNNDIGKMDQQDERDIDQKEEKDQKIETETEQQHEQKIETELGVVTVSKQQAIPGEKVRIAVEPKEQNIQSIKGSLQLQKNDSQYDQKRLLSFAYEDETKQWVTYYTVGPYDLEGDWHLQLMQSRKEDGKEELEEREEKVPLVHIKNETPTLDKEPPKLEQIIIDGAKDGVVERKIGDSFNIRVKASDAESAVKEVRVVLKGKENSSEITFSLDYNKREMDWRKMCEVTEALQAGTYRLSIEIVDAAGNQFVQESEYVISVRGQQAKENEQQEGLIQANKQEEQHIKQEQVTGKEEKMAQVVDVPKKQEEPTHPQQEATKVHKKTTDEKDDKAASKKQEQVESQKEKKQPKNEQGIEASDVFAVISGLFVLFFVLKNNKEWG
ncbi:transglycosylase [Bacillus pseudomycoides]|uniref:Transglycosylase n=1 Tax=Bacillus pseudomycoides TaxID=64104 RepID=A0AA91ZTK9_9BACI|nr:MULTISPECIES: transglycosylase [Bacillus]PEB53956.1 transglycosylase [Bacillus sp. AFS098217]PED82931.1 transglycosylase [Bacillus pseudomycoides]PEU07452.1 transglycosylase [Bacillus sp. AFS019443]PEU17416.1 transglycosylase [Bacillus sp. AFS014408]PFW62558.1 transglycosylase [Bacillus sp. AFS075034]